MRSRSQQSLEFVCMEELELQPAHQQDHSAFGDRGGGRGGLTDRYGVPPLHAEGDLDAKGRTVAPLRVVTS
jgi:hypothetical protein